MWDTCINMVELEFPILLNSIHSLQKEVSVDIGED